MTGRMRVTGHFLASSIAVIVPAAACDNHDRCGEVPCGPLVDGGVEGGGGDGGAAGSICPNGDPNGCAPAPDGCRECIIQVVDGGPLETCAQACNVAAPRCPSGQTCKSLAPNVGASQSMCNQSVDTGYCQ